MKRGQTHSPATRSTLAELARGRMQSAEARAKVGAATRGRPVSDETRAKISAALRGRTWSPLRRGKHVAPENRFPPESPDAGLIEHLAALRRFYPRFPNVRFKQG